MEVLVMLVYWALGCVALFLVTLLTVGICELIVETRQDSIIYEKSSQFLHLKHLEHINNGK